MHRTSHREPHPGDAAATVFTDASEMGRLCRRHDWAATPLGPVATWPQSLRTAASTVIAYGFPSIVLWGPDLIQIYNDGYIPVHGAKHPWGLGRPTNEVWPEVWHLNEPLFRRAQAGESLALTEAPYALARRGPGEPADEVFVDLSFSPIMDESGGVGGVLVSLIDVTAVVENRRLQQELERLLASERAARADAEAANRAKADFLAAMSHELRTPLNAISGYVDLLDLGVHGPITDAQRHALSRVTANQRHLLRLINDVLAFAKLEAGRIGLDIRPLSAGALLRSVEPLVAPIAETKGVSLGIDACDEALRLIGDEERVRQILLNLVANAVKFTPAGGRIALFCEAHDEWIDMRVRDSGPGIAPEKQKRIFDPFIQVDRRLNHPQDGVGLGLAISRDLAQLMGGELSVASAPGAGSTFTLRMPAARVAAADG